MSLKRFTYCLVVATMLMISRSEAQLFSDPGQLSGSGLTIMPTATIAPPMEYRVHFSRTTFLGGRSTGLNLMSLTAGLSSTLEGYMRIGSEQCGSFSSQIAYGFGGKFRVPMLLPIVRRLAVWSDITTSDQIIGSALFPSDAYRAGIATTFDSNGVHPTLLIGISTVAKNSTLLLGSGVVIALGNSKQVGFEVVSGYLGRSSIQINASGSMRILNNIGVHFSPGYLSTPVGSAWTVSLGISFSTTDIDYHPVVEENRPDDFILPSIEEIEKETQNVNEDQPSGGVTMPEVGKPDIGKPESKSTDGTLSLQSTGSNELLLKPQSRSKKITNTTNKKNVKVKKSKHE